MVNENNNINLMAKENLAKVETVQELKNEYKVPSYEEFMKSYECDEKLNYDDLNGGSVGSSESYGPCHSCGNKSLKFRLEITLKNWDGVFKTGRVHSTEHAERVAREIRNGTGFWADGGKAGSFSNESRHALANKVMNQVDIHKNGSRVDTEVSYQDDCSIM